MAEEAGYGQFFVLLDLMTAALVFMVIAGDLITLLIAWVTVGFHTLKAARVNPVNYLKEE